MSATRKLSNRWKTCVITNVPYKRGLQDKQSFVTRSKRRNDERKAISGTDGARKTAKQRRVPPNFPAKDEEDVSCLNCGETFEESVHVKC